MPENVGEGSYALLKTDDKSFSDARNEMPSKGEACKSCDDGFVLSPKCELKSRTMDIDKTYKVRCVLTNDDFVTDTRNETPSKSDAIKSSDYGNFEPPTTEPDRRRMDSGTFDSKDSDRRGVAPTTDDDLLADYNDASGVNQFSDTVCDLQQASPLPKVTTDITTQQSNSQIMPDLDKSDEERDVMTNDDFVTEINDEMPSRTAASNSSDCGDFLSPKTEPDRRRMDLGATDSNDSDGHEVKPITDDDPLADASDESGVNKFIKTVYGSNSGRQQDSPLPEVTPNTNNKQGHSQKMPERNGDGCDALLKTDDDLLTDTRNEMPSTGEVSKSCDDGYVLPAKRTMDLDTSDEERDVLTHGDPVTETRNEMPSKRDALKSSDCDFQSPKTESDKSGMALGAVDSKDSDGRDMTPASDDDSLAEANFVTEMNDQQRDSPLQEVTPDTNIQQRQMMADNIRKQTHDKTTLTDYRRTRVNENPNSAGKPSALDVTTDYVHICWEKPETVSDTDTYQVRYKEDPGGKWVLCNDQFEQNQARIYGLKSGTSYIFKVRTVYDDGESPFSEDSDVIKTHPTFASKLVQCSTIVGNETTRPTKYTLPLTEGGRNEEYKTKRCDIGEKSKLLTSEKTIMLLGATGTGKSTFVDALANYVLGVNLEDPYRFTVMDGVDRKQLENQALSQTDWVTCYSFNPQVGTRIKYQLNVIDTPGFGDTRGLERDHHIVEQIRHLFEQTGERGIQYIDAVCFIVKAPDARLTTTQRYIFHAIMSIFGKDIEPNICTLITFVDGTDPPVLSALKESGLPFGRHFTFNNSAFFAQTASLNPLTQMFWKMCMESFRDVFDHIKTKETKSIQLTKEVLRERSRLDVTIENLQPEIDAGLAKIRQLEDERKIFEENEAIVKANKDFHYMVTEVQNKKIDLEPGLHTTTCLTCNRTCHQDCKIRDDDAKRGCWAMDGNGYCTQCPGKCFWKEHKNRPYLLTYSEVKVQKTYEEKLKKYKEADGKRPTLKQLLDKMDAELELISDTMEDMMKAITDCKNRLKEIALIPNPLGMKEEIELRIMSERKEKRDGFIDRIRILEGFLEKASIHDIFKKFREEKSNALKTT